MIIQLESATADDMEAARRSLARPSPELGPRDHRGPR